MRGSNRGVVGMLRVTGDEMIPEARAKGTESGDAYMLLVIFVRHGDRPQSNGRPLNHGWSPALSSSPDLLRIGMHS